MPKISKKTIFLVILIIAAISGAIVFVVGSKKQVIFSQVADNEQQQQQQPNEQALSPDSIPAMSQKEYNGSDLKLVRVITKNQYYTKYSITYKSEGFKISGIMNVPTGKGPFPMIVINHGYIDPAVYKNGAGLPREDDFFAKHGYVVLHSDYRNYALSDFDPANEVRPRSGYVEDVLNAVAAAKNSNFDFIDKSNIGMLGHSMGGGVTLNIMVTKPDTAKAYALLAPINADYKVNFDRWVKNGWPQAAKQFYDQYGTYEQNPQVWESFSAKNYFDRIDAPVMLHQGTADDQVPVQWSRDLAQDLKDKGKEITYYEYPGDGHVFMKAQSLAMQRTLTFFDKILKNK